MAKKSLRFHATVKMVFDCQLEIDMTVAVSRLRRNTSVLWRILIVALVTLRSVVW